MANIGYRRDIDGLRALAVVPVVLNHAGIPGFPGGFIGVDIFFVISGYLITGILAREIERDTFSIVHFYERRARRILPALGAVIAACFLAGWFFLLPDEMTTLGKNAIAAIAFVSNVAFWWTANDYFAESVALQPLLHTWSLSVEEQFYLFFPILLWFLAKFSRSVLLVSIAVLCALSFAASIWATEHAPTANFYLIFFRIWELGFGSLLALGSANLPHGRAAREIGSALGIALIVGSIVTLDEFSDFPGLSALPACLGSTLLIWAGSTEKAGQPFFNRLLALKPLVGIGLISYSLYLWHWPVLVAARIFEQSVTIPLDVALLCISLSVLLAWLSWRFVEQPFRGGPDRPQLSRKQIFGWSAASMGALSAVGAAMIVTGGIPARLGNEAGARYAANVARAPIEVDCINRSPDEDPCILGGGSPDYVLWGDSHAGSLIPALQSYVTSRGQSAVVFTKAACAPLLGVLRLDQEGNVNCDVHNRGVLERIKTDYSDATVIMLGRWALLAEGERYIGEEGVHPVIARADGLEVALEAYPKVVKAGLSGAVDALAGNGNSVIVVKGIPELGFGAPGVLARHEWLGWDLPVLTSEAMQERQGRARALIDNVASESGVSVIDPADYLCGRVCAYARGKEALYRDDDHLSRSGADWLLPQLLRDAEAGDSKFPGEVLDTL
ncbi:acyltransferase family protein [Erythrobacter vulgaris]|uniref:Acyltransferase family protein n=1 Tax=Qipengyuania vulgaris TaxID=291985 RepID=A0A844XTD7_9SPHN|nr:acyltransferase family protein [Qipengyuania vulgaris]MXO49355.1 acyltransferase family protein [Qipengyuania vulgaris]